MIPLREAFINKKNLHKVSIKAPNPFGLTEKDLKVELEGYPMGVVVRMLEEQESQENKPDVKVFQDNVAADIEQGGFLWEATEAGDEFWEAVLSYKEFHRFFEKYPEYKKYNV